jgi:hypothetical protein
MTHKELIPKLIEHYQFGIDNLPMEDYFGFLYKNNLGCGICRCANHQFNEIVYNEKWIAELTKNKGIICDYPVLSKNRTECIGLLQIRLDALKSIDINTIEL